MGLLNFKKPRFSASNYTFTLTHISIFISYQAKKCSRVNAYERFVNTFVNDFLIVSTILIMASAAYQTVNSHLLYMICKSQR
jgi:hypothetical protein